MNHVSTHKNRIDRNMGDEVRRLLLPNMAGPESWKDVKFMIFDMWPDSMEKGMKSCPYMK
jgi:hypothetical protein